MEPGPMPIFTPSAPAFIKSSAPLAVPTLPAISSRSLWLLLSVCTAVITFSVCPCEVSIRTTSAPAFMRVSVRSCISGPTPTAAPARSRPIRSLHALGYFFSFSMSLMVIRPVRWPFLSTTSNFSIRCWCSSCLESSREIPSVTVTRFSLVITSETFFSRSVSNRKSRLVTIPTSWSPFVTGTPEMRYFPIKASTSSTFCSGRIVTGSTIIPLSDFLTLSTSMAWLSMLILRWIKPMPPSRAMLMAVSASVTVSMAALTIGMFRVIFWVSRVLTLTSLGNTSE